MKILKAAIVALAALCQCAYAQTLPGGRLSLTTNPVMSGDVTSPTLYYPPYISDSYPALDATMTWQKITFSSSPTDQVGTMSMAGGTKWAAGTSRDIFGTAMGQMCSGPAWLASDMASRQITRYNGVLVNSAVLSCDTSSIAAVSCAQYQCTKLGSIQISIVGQLTVQFEGASRKFEVFTDYQFNDNVMVAGVPLTTNPAWATPTASTQRLSCIGGVTTIVGSYTIHVFNSSDVAHCTGTGALDWVVVAGGGGAGAGPGGGGGGVLSGTDVMTAGDYPVMVGAGGVSGSLGTNGSNSSFNGHIAFGGGGGASPAGAAGGSGGGGYTGGGGASTSGQGNAGGGAPLTSAFGGGGGCAQTGGAAGGSPAQGGKGGDGCALSISGTTALYGPGGGGGGNPHGGTGGAGGGGQGENLNSNDMTAGTPNTGAGGGGDFGTGYSGTKGYGGSGVVILRHAT